MTGSLEQTLAWMRKDVRSLGWLTPASAAITFACSFAGHPELFSGNAGGQGVLGAAGALLTGVMVLGWWALAERVMHTDPVPGDREAWYTVPVPRTLLAASKIALVAILAFLPRLVGDVALAAWTGADLTSIAPSLLSRTLFHFALFLLPAIVISAMTPNLGQFFVAVIATALFLYIIVVLMAVPFSKGWSLTGDASWIPIWILVLAGTVVGTGLTFWLYQERRTAAARVTALGLLAVSFLGAPWISPETQWRWHHWLRGEPALERAVTFALNEAELLLPADSDPADETRYPERRRRPVREGASGLPVPLRLQGVPEDLYIVGRGGTFVIRTPDGRTYAGGEIHFPDFRSGEYREIPTRTPTAWLALSVGQVMGLPDVVKIEISLRGEVFRGQRHSIAVKPGWNSLAGFGNCWRGAFAFCTSFGPQFPFARFEPIDPNDRVTGFGWLVNESAMVPVPGWSPIEFAPLAIFNGPELGYQTWKYRASVEVGCEIANYRASEYTFPSAGVSWPHGSR